MTKSLFYISISLLMMTGILSINGCSKKADETPSGGDGNPSANMLKNVQKGRPFSNGFIVDFVLAEKDNQVVLMAANNNTGMVYAIDLKDNDASNASANSINGNVSDFGNKIVQTMGVPANQLSILNMEVNPISKSLYVLVYNGGSMSSAILKLTNNGSVCTMLDLNNVDYVSMAYSTVGERVNDMAWGSGGLYVSCSHPSTLVGKVASGQAPFDHNKAMSNRATTVFKTNWGDNYYTNAPLESMCYAEIGGVKRLMGVTVCAPGYAVKISDITSGSGLQQVNEYFNLNTGSAVKVYAVAKGGKTYMIEHHSDGRITRVGEKYIDQSQTQFNADAKYLLQANGTVAAGLNDEDVKIVAQPSADYLLSTSNLSSQILVFKTDGSLSAIDF